MFSPSVLLCCVTVVLAFACGVTVTAVVLLVILTPISHNLMQTVEQCYNDKRGKKTRVSPNRAHLMQPVAALTPCRGNKRSELMNETEMCQTHTSSGGQSVICWQSGQELPSCYFKSWTSFIQTRIVWGKNLRGFKAGITGTLPHNSLSRVLCSPSVPQHCEPRKAWFSPTESVTSKCVCLCVYECVCAQRRVQWQVLRLWSASSMITTSVSKQCKNTGLYKHI